MRFKREIIASSNVSKKTLPGLRPLVTELLLCLLLRLDRSWIVGIAVRVKAPMLVALFACRFAGCKFCFLDI